MPKISNIDPSTATATQLQLLLKEKAVLSVELVDLYLDQIKKHNHKGAGLNAVISTSSRERAGGLAHELDIERGVRGPMNGMPVVVKVHCRWSIFKEIFC